MRRTALVPLALAAALAACGGKYTTASGEMKYGKSAEENYQAGQEELNAKHYPDAVKFFEFVKTKYPFSKFAALSELRLADLKFQQERWPEAAEDYQRFAQLHPTHEDVDYADFRIGLSRYKDAPTDFFLFPPSYEKDQKAINLAGKAFRDFLAKHPDSKYVPEAKRLLAEVDGRLADHEWYVAEFYLKRDLWAGAAGRLEGLVKSYPGNRHEVPALLRLADAYEKLNEKFRARTALQQLIAKHPDDPRRTEAERRLASLR